MKPVNTQAITDQSDEALLTTFAQGDRAALAELARRHERALLGLCCGLLNGRRDLAMDIVQETWLRVIRFAPNFNGSSSVKTWLYRITINQCRTLQVKMAREAKRVRSPDLVERGDAGVGNDVVAPASILDDDTNTRLHAAVARLDISRRTLVLLCYHAGVTHPQAAEILGIPLGTLKSRLHATLKQLRELLPEEVHT